jgi:hypothetical protein
MLFGFEQVLMQIAVVANGTTAEVAGDAFVNSINSLLGSATALIIAVSGIVVAIIAARSNGRTKTKQEEQAVGVAEAIQVVMQKLREEQASKSIIAKQLFTVATTDEQRKQLDEQVAPIIRITGERMETINKQIPAVKELIGVKTADVNTKDIPRESDATLAIVNKAVDDTKTNA